VFKGKMWLSNGFYHGNITHRDLWSSPDGLTWTKHSPEVPFDEINKTHGGMPYDAYSELVVFKDKLWAVKGSVWDTDDGKTWELFPMEGAFSPRHEPTIYVFDGSLWVVAGNSWPVNPSSSVSSVKIIIS